MWKYITNRLWQMVVTIVMVSILSFFVVSMMPKDQVYSLYGNDITQEEYDAAYKELKLDKSVVVRFLYWAGDALRGDLGSSYKYRMPIMEVMGPKLAITLYLSIISTLISFPVGIIFGIITATKRGKWQDSVFTFLANLTASIPSFVVAIAILYLFCMKWKLLPTNGFTWPWDGFTKHILQIILPMFALSLSGIASITRQTRSSVLEVIGQDYIRTSRSKGLKEKFIVYKHVMRNALIPVVTLFGNRLAFMIGGSLFVEAVFSIPGMGTLMVQSVNSMDVPVIQASVLLSALAISVAYLITDILYMAIDPRITLQ